MRKLPTGILLACAIATFATAQNGCSDNVVVRMPETTKEGRDLGCGGITGQVGPVVLQRGTCPSFIKVTPEHDTTRHSEDSETYTVPAGQQKITLLTFNCQTQWFLFVPVGSYCRLHRQSVIGSLTTYAQLPCGSGQAGAGS